MTSQYATGGAGTDRRVLGPALSAAVIVVLSAAAIVGIGLSGGESGQDAGIRVVPMSVETAPEVVPGG